MIRDNVKTICSAQGKTLADLAAALNVSRQSLHRYTTGRPTLDTITRIAEALAVPPFVLLHPVPLAALAQLRTGQMEPAPAPSPLSSLPVILCPVCHAPLSIVQAGEPSPSSQDQPQPMPQQPRKRGRPRKTSPEESKLF